MDDITLSLTIPDNYVNRVKEWIDNVHPKPSDQTYPQWLKILIKDYIKHELRVYEWQKAQGSIIITDIYVT